jgi:pimeloyl-ACP methyl ester carboxylesterase
VRRPATATATAATALATVLAACSSATPPVDGGPADTGADAGTPPPDGGFHNDAQPLPDSGPADAGFADPDTILEGGYHVGPDGLETYLLVMGTQTSTMPPLIIVPDGPGLSHEYLLPHMKALLPGRRLVFYDLRATGGTDFGTLTANSTITAAQDVIDLGGVADFVAQFLPEGAPKVDLLGHGYGGGIAALYAAAHPGKVSRLILSNPFPTTIDEYVSYQGEVLNRLTTPDIMKFNALEQQPMCRGHDECRLAEWMILGPHYLCPANATAWYQLTFTAFSVRKENFVERQLMNIMYDWRPALATVTARTSVVSGACDPIPAMAAAEYAARIPGAVRYDFADSGHFPMVEVKDRYFALLRTLLVYP